LLILLRSQIPFFVKISNVRKSYANLSEAKTGYALQMALYTGKTSDTDPKAVSVSVTLGVVKQPVSPHFGQCHILFTHSYCSSPTVADRFSANQTGFCGTCNANRTGMPHDIRPSNMPMQKEDDPAFRRNGLKLACTWQDIKRVTFLSTVDNNTSSSVDIHSSASSGTKIIFMGGVDTLDQWFPTRVPVAMLKGAARYCNTAAHS